MAGRQLQHVTAIRPARPGELSRLGPLYVRSGFDARLAKVVGFARARLGGEVFVAVPEGELAGVAAGAWFGATGWVGGVAVAPERRRAGLGGALTEAVIAHLQGRGAATVLLHATDAGRRVYQRLGFLAEGEYLTLAGPPLPAAGPAGNGVRPGQAGDLAAVSALDRQAARVGPRSPPTRRPGCPCCRPPAGWTPARSPSRCPTATRRPAGRWPPPASASAPAPPACTWDPRSRGVRPPSSAASPCSGVDA